MPQFEDEYSYHPRPETGYVSHRPFYAPLSCGAVGPRVRSGVKAVRGWASLLSLEASVLVPMARDTGANRVHVPPLPHGSHVSGKTNK